MTEDKARYEQVLIGLITQVRMEKTFYEATWFHVVTSVLVKLYCLHAAVTQQTGCTAVEVQSLYRSACPLFHYLNWSDIHNHGW